MRDLEREKMLRMDAEHRLHNMTIDSDNCKSRLQALQQDFKKMEEMVRGMMQYKGKIDILKQEKSNLTVTFETSMKKYHSRISNLEHENKLLLAEIKRLEGQPNNCSDEEKSKLLLERLKRLEGENSRLVLENEQQRQQYEKCLDDIANQVVQALMTQKSLREECMKLRKRVQDLEQQNRELNLMFQQRLRFTSDSFLQSLANRKLQHSQSKCEACHSSTDGCFHSLPTTSQQLPTTSQQLPTTSQSQTSQSPVCQNKPSPRPATGASETAYLDDSFESLHSIFSDCNDNAQLDDSLGKPQLSSPPPWLRDKLFPTMSSQTSEDGSCGGTSKFASPQEKLPSGRNCEKITSQQTNSSKPDTTYTSVLTTSQPQAQTKINTEFPASNTSLKMTYRNIALPLEGASVSCDTAVVQESNVPVLLPGGSENMLQSFEDGHLDIAECAHEAAAQLTKPSQESALNTNSEKESDKCDISPGRELLKLSDSFSEKFMLYEGDGLPVIQDEFDDSDDESVSLPHSKHISVASTVSLNELLERGLDDMETPVDDNFEIDSLPFFQTQDSKLDYFTQCVNNNASESEPEEISPNQIKLAISALPKEMCLNNCAQNNHASTSASRNNAVILNNSNANNNNSSSSHSTAKPLMQRPNSLDIASTGNDKKYNTCSMGNEEGSPTPTNSVMNSVSAACGGFYSYNQQTTELLYKTSPCLSISSSSKGANLSTAKTGCQPSLTPNVDNFPLFKKPLPPKLPPRKAPPKPPRPPALPPKISRRTLEQLEFCSARKSVKNGPSDNCGLPPPLPPRNNLYSSCNLQKDRGHLSRLSDMPPPPPPRPHHQKDCNRADQLPLKQSVSHELCEGLNSGSSSGEVIQKPTLNAESDLCAGNSDNGKHATEAAGSKPVPCENGSSNLSPDSAMQQSFSSTYSNGSDILSDTKPISSSRDDGYSSLSSDVQPEVMEKFAFIKKIPKLGHHVGGGRRSVSVNGECESAGSSVDECKPCDSDSSNTSTSSIESFTAAKVKDIQAFCEASKVVRGESQHHTLPKSKPSMIKYVSESDRQIQCQVISMQGRSKGLAQTPQKTQEISSRSYDSLFSTRFFYINSLQMKSVSQEKMQPSLMDPDNSMASSSETAVPYNHHLDACIITPQKVAKRIPIKATTCGSHKNRPHVRVRLNWDGSPILQRSASEGFINNMTSDSEDSADDALSTASTSRGQHHKHSNRDGTNKTRFIRRHRIHTKNSSTSQNTSAQTAFQMDKGKSSIPNNITDHRRFTKSSDSAANAGKINDMNIFVSSDTDSDLEDTVNVNFLEMRKERESPAMKLLEWDPKLTASCELKKNQFRSPLSCGKLNASSVSEHWLLNFSKADTDQQLNKSTACHLASRVQTFPRQTHRQPSTARQTSRQQPSPARQTPRQPLSSARQTPRQPLSSARQTPRQPLSPARQTPRQPLSPARQIPCTNITITNHDISHNEFRREQDRAACKNEEKLLFSKQVNQNRKPVNHNSSGSVYQSPRSPFMGMSSVHRCRASESDSKTMNVENLHFNNGNKMQVLIGCVNTSPHHRRSSSVSSTTTGIKNKPQHQPICEMETSKNSSIDENGKDFTQQITHLSRTVDGIQKCLNVCDDSVMTDSAGGNDKCCSREYYAWLDESLEIPVADVSIDGENINVGSVIASDMDDTISIQSANDIATGVLLSYHHGNSQQVEEKRDCVSSNHDNSRPEEADDVLDAEKQAKLLDSMVSEQEKEREKFDLNEDIAAKINAKKGKHEALRHPISPNKVLFFKRFGAEEEQAISKFSFLDELSSTSPSDDGTHEHHNGSSDKEADKDNQATLPHVNKENEQVDSITVNGIIDYNGDMMRALRLNPVKNRALDTLKEEMRVENNRLSTATFDQLTFGEDGLSLSDSCCESFSSSNMSVNDITVP